MTSHLLAFSLPSSTTGSQETISLPQQIQHILDVLAPVDIAKSSYLPGAVFVGWALDFALTAATLTALGFMLYAGWKWITSNGDAKNLETAHNIIIYAAVGMGVVMLSAAFVNLAATFFCIPFLGFLPQACH